MSLMDSYICILVAPRLRLGARFEPPKPALSCFFHVFRPCVHLSARWTQGSTTPSFWAGIPALARGRRPVLLNDSVLVRATDDHSRRLITSQSGPWARRLVCSASWAQTRVSTRSFWSFACGLGQLLWRAVVSHLAAMVPNHGEVSLV